jgi:antitoxin (DNA-binding transcriptional repressor) of toxin-antitoxin stability system
VNAERAGECSERDLYFYLQIMPGHVTGKMEINASEFKAKCLALIDQVHQGGEPILIRKLGRIVAKLTGESEPENRPWFILRGKSRFVGDPYAPVQPK